MNVDIFISFSKFCYLIIIKSEKFTVIYGLLTNTYLTNVLLYSVSYYAPESPQYLRPWKKLSIAIQQFRYKLTKLQYTGWMVGSTLKQH